MKLELTAKGITDVVFEVMQEKECSEDEAIAAVLKRVAKRTDGVKEIWEAEGGSILRHWLGEAMRGYLYSGPRPSKAPLNTGLNRRKERQAIIGPMDSWIRVPGKGIKTVGDLTRQDLAIMIGSRAEIAERNHYHASEWAHVRDQVDEAQTLRDCVDSLDERASSYLLKVARIQVVEEAS